MTSNGLLTRDYWQGFAHLFDWICLSYHPEFVDDERFYSVVRYMHESTDIVVPAIRLMMLEEIGYWNRCIVFADRIKLAMSNWAIEYVKI